MYSLKEIVSDKLSHLFSDSPSSSSSSSASSSSVAPLHHQPQAKQYTKEGKYLSSVFSYILPSKSFNGFRSNNQQHDIKPIQSLTVRWKSRSFSRQDKPLDNYAECEFKCQNEEPATLHGNDGEHGFVMGQTRDDEETFGAPKENGDHGS